MTARTTLIAFLGGGKYNEVNYHFDDEKTISIKDKLFSFALLKKLRHYDAKKVHQFAILGTNRSSWKTLFEHPSLESFVDADKIAEIQAQVENKTLNQNYLNHLASILTQALNVECCLRLIPEANSQEEQIEVLETMMSFFEPESDDVAILDITHGFRSLPFLSALSALLLKIVYKINLDDIYYGKYEFGETEGYACKLYGFLEIADWLEAFSRFNTSANYGVFADLMAKNIHDAESQKTLVDSFKTSSYFDTTFQLGEAKKPMKDLKKSMQTTQFDGVSRLFKSNIIERLNQINEGTHSKRQFARAKVHLQHDNYLEACCLGYESMLSKVVDDLNKQLPKNQQYDIDDYNDRRKAEEIHLKSEKNQALKNYLQLKRIRNALAHGTETPDNKTLTILKDQQKLTETLWEIFDHHESSL